MNNETTLLVYITVAFALGGSLAWYLARQKVQLAFEQGLASISPELAVVKARLDITAEECQELHNEKSGIEMQANEFRAQLDASRDECARLNERATRIAPLEESVGLLNAELASLAKTNAEHRENLGRLEAERDAGLEQVRLVSGELSETKAAYEVARLEVQRLTAELKEAATLLETEQAKTAEKLELLSQAQAQMSDQFKVLAADILTEKAKAFGEQSETSLTTLLAPLKEKIATFQSKVEEVYLNEAKERHTLQDEIKRLAELNVQISDDAVKLTKALKGESKTQGIWGERILESVLDSSGLRKGEEYEVQASFQNEEGKRSQPDVVINLPEGKHLVVDSKVSLTAYERFVNAESDAEGERELKSHLASLSSHVDNLSDKKYQALYGLKSLDFVLMFIPVEPAFMLGVANDQELFNRAFSKNVLLVSPSTLLATLRTIANIWRQEYQSRNAQTIAKHCASLYDKFAGFVADMEDIGKKLDATKKSYDEARSKLSTGKGNLINQVERVRKLGVKPNKALPASLLEQAVEDFDREEFADEAAG